MSVYSINGQAFNVAVGVEDAYGRRTATVDVGIACAAEMLKDLPPVIVWGGCMDQMLQAVPGDKRDDPDVMHAISVAAAAIVRLAQAQA